MIIAKLKTINELVKEGYEVNFDDDGDIIITNKNVEAEINYDAFIKKEIEVKKDHYDDYIYSTNSWVDVTIHPEFIKEIDNPILSTFELSGYTLELNKDLSVKVGCQNIDKKLALKIAKEIMKANGYEIAG